MSGHIIVIRTTDLLEVEHVLDALEAAGVSARERVDQGINGLIGSLDQEFVVEVSAEDEARARAALSELAPPAPVTAEPAGLPEAPPAFAVPQSWARASMLALVLDLTFIALATLASAVQPVWVFASAIVDFLVWRTLTAPDAAERSVRRARVLGLARAAGGVALGVALLPSLAGIVGVVAAGVVGLLYLPGPIPPAEGHH